MDSSPTKSYVVGTLLHKKTYRGDSNEYPQHMFFIEKKKKKKKNTKIIPKLSNYPQILSLFVLLRLPVSSIRYLLITSVETGSFINFKHGFDLYMSMINYFWAFLTSSGNKSNLVHVWDMFIIFVFLQGFLPL